MIESNTKELMGGHTLLEGMLRELGIYDTYQIMKLCHDWEEVAGPIVAQHAKIVEITPPTLVLEIGHTVWMQEMVMRTPQLLEALQDYYGAPIIEDIKVQLPRKSLGEQQIRGDVLDMTPVKEERIDFHKVPVSDEEVEEIRKSVSSIHNEELRKMVFNMRIQQVKKDKVLLASNYHRCPSCGRWQETTEVCVLCEYKRYRSIIQTIKGILRKYPHYKYDQVKSMAPWCTYEWFRVAKRESIQFYLTRLFQGSTDANDMYWATMLITSKSQEELSYEQVVNITNKYRWNETDKMQVK